MTQFRLLFLERDPTPAFCARPGPAQGRVPASRGLTLSFLSLWPGRRPSMGDTPASDRLLLRLRRHHGNQQGAGWGARRPNTPRWSISVSTEFSTILLNRNVLTLLIAQAVGL